jgi:hypothetical protein
MTHIFARLAGCATILAALVLAPPATAAGVKSHGQAAKARQYAKQCGKARHGRGASACIAAMRKLAAGRSASPRAACAGLSHKPVKGAGAQPVSQRTAAAAAGGDPAGASGDESGDQADPVDDSPDDPTADPTADPTDDPTADDSPDDGTGDDPTDPGAGPVAPDPIFP